MREKKQKEQSKNIKKSIAYVFKTIAGFDKNYLPLTGVNMVILAASPLIMVVLPKLAIDAIFNEQNLTKALVFVGCMTGLLFLSQSAGLLLDAQLQIRNNRINIKLQEILARKAISLDYEKLETPKAYDEFTFSKTCVDRSSVSVQLNAFSKIIAGMVTLAGILYILAPILAVILPIAIITMGLRSVFEGKLKKTSFWNDKQYQPFIRKKKYASENLTDYSYGKEIRLFSLQNFVSGKFLDLCKELYRLRFKALRPYIKYTIILELLSNVLSFVMYGYVAYRFVNNRMTLGDFSMYFASVFGFTEAIKNIFSSVSSLKNESRYINHYRDFLEQEEQCQLGTLTTKGLENTVLTFEFCGVSYAYPGHEDYVLKGINLTLHSDEKLSVVGINGAGKTTFIKLLMGLLKPTKGKILLNGVNIQEYDFSEYMDLFSTVFQDFNIYSFIVSENISFDEEIDKAKMETVLAKIGLNEQIDELQNKENTFMSKRFDEEGVDLSGGQQQKLAIARALYKDAPVYIFDEPTAALSPQAEYDIYRNFEEITHGKMVIYISHRLASSKFCDKIAVFCDGKIKEFGTHDSLMQNDGLYAKMFQMQADYYVDELSEVVCI